MKKRKEKKRKEKKREEKRREEKRREQVVSSLTHRSPIRTFPVKLIQFANISLLLPYSL
ncbi:MAG: hypothetical protein WBB47_11890 [Paenisporosarcina sp.]